MSTILTVNTTFYTKDKSQFPCAPPILQVHNAIRNHRQASPPSRPGPPETNHSYLTASSDLHNAFASFVEDRSLFALPISITSESLTPLSPLPFHDSKSFSQSLPQLQQHCDPKKPCYITLRRRSPSGQETSEDGGGGGAGLTIITYIPTSAPVRAKTLFASTRATVVKELGRERFEANLFLTEAREVLDPREWEERDGGEGVQDGLLTTEERELRGVKSAEEEERYAGTKGRDLMGNGGSGGDKDQGVKTKGLKMKMDDKAREALREMGQGAGREGDGRVVQLSIDIATELLMLSFSSSDVSPAELSSKIPSDRPSYTFYHDPSTTSILFIYCCPGSSKIKERMLYAASRANLVYVAKDEAVEVSKRIEIGSPDEIDEQRLKEEMEPPAGEGAGSGARQGFARPKRPGKR